MKLETRVEIVQLIHCLPPGQMVGSLRQSLSLALQGAIEVASCLQFMTYES